MKVRQLMMEHGSSNPVGNEGQGRTGNQYAPGGRSGNYPLDFGRRGYNNQYRGNYQSRDFVPPSYSSQLDYTHPRSEGTTGTS